ncbi:MAG: hypothetical protein GKR99_18865 [Rhodobacteraceae bacterium]|nr:hypothetical protein [Paracoccaceae bacterium]
MGQILHGSAKTTHAVRALIQRSKTSNAALRLGRPNRERIPQTAHCLSRGEQNTRDSKTIEMMEHSQPVNRDTPSNVRDT